MVKNMNLKEDVSKLFSEEIAHIKEKLIFNAELIIESEAWKALELREERLGITLDSIVDTTNDSLCVLFNNLKQFLNGSDEYLLSYIGESQFVDKLEDAKKNISASVEDELVSILEGIEKQNSLSLIEELETFDAKSDGSVEPLKIDNLSILSLIGIEYLSRKLDILNLDDLLDAKSFTDSTLEMVELDDMGGLMLDQLKDSLSGLFSEEALGEGK